MIYVTVVYRAQENQCRLFKEIVQFSPGKLQKGGGSGLGLYSEYIMSIYQSLPHTNLLYLLYYPLLSYTSLQRHYETTPWVTVCVLERGGTGHHFHSHNALHSTQHNALYSALYCE